MVHGAILAGCPDAW